MKKLGLILMALTLLSWQALAFPKKSNLAGVIEFDSGLSMFIGLDLKLKSSSATTAQYEGTLTYTQNNRYYKRKAFLTINHEDNETTGLIEWGGDTVRISGPAVELKSGHEIELDLKKYRAGEEKCHPKRPEGQVCQRAPDRVIDMGYLIATMN